MEYTINYKIIGDQLFIDEPTNYCNYNQYISLYILTLNSNIVDRKITDHNGLDEVIFSNLKDGHYKIYKVIIPKFEYLNTDDLNTMLKYKHLIVYKDSSIYEYLFRSESLKDVNNILNITYSNLKIDYQELFIYSNIENCLKLYIAAYNEVLNLQDDSLPECDDCRNLNKKDLWKRILYINTMLSMIKYFVNCNNYMQATKILNKIPYCNVRERNN